MTRILIADDHDVVRSGVRRIIEDQPGWSVVAEATDGKDAIAQAIATKPDVAILDYRLPLIDGIEATRQIRRRVPKVEVLIFTMHDDEELLREVLVAGARGYVLKSDAAQHLISAVQSLADHKPFFTDRASEVLLDTFLTKAGQVKPTLTGREQVVVQLVAEGHTNKEIAAVLGISIKTVETHRAAVMRKLDLTSTAALVRYAVRRKWSHRPLNRFVGAPIDTRWWRAEILILGLRTGYLRACLGSMHGTAVDEVPWVRFPWSAHLVGCGRVVSHRVEQAIERCHQPGLLGLRARPLQHDETDDESTDTTQAQLNVSPSSRL